MRGKMIDVPMEPVSDSAVKMNGYELYCHEWGDRMTKRIETHDEGNSHPKPLENVSQGPDRKRIRVGWVDDGEGIKSHSSHEHLKRA